MDPNELPVRTGVVRPACLDDDSCPTPETEHDDGERIFSGEEAKPHAYPWMVRIIGCRKSDDGSTSCWVCGGSIISPDYVLTAAHCVEDGIIFRVQAGSHDFTKTEASRVSMDCSSCEIIHEDYKFPRNDVALIKVPTPFQFNEHITSICISNYNVPVGSQGAAMGWGKTGDSASVSPALQFVDGLSVISNEEAVKVYGSNVKEENLCIKTSYSSGNKGTCQVYLIIWNMFK